MPDREPIQLLFSKINRAVEKLARKASPENVHGFRTSARRLETVLQAATPDQHRKLLKRLARWRRRAGMVRDVDVQIKALRSLKLPEEPQRKSQLMSSLLDLRIRRERKLSDAFDKDTQRRLLKRLEKAEDTAGAIQQGGDLLQKARQMFVELANQQSAVTEDSVHEYRLQCKRIRYIAELAHTPDAKALVADLVRIQDATGDWRDWQMLTATAEAQFRDAGRSALLAALRNVTQAKFREAVRVCSQVRSEMLGQQAQPASPRKAASSVKAERAVAANA